MTVCTTVPSLYGIIIAVLLLASGFYFGGYRVQKMIRRRVMKVLYCAVIVVFLLAASLFIVALTRSFNCPSSGIKNELVHDYNTSVNSRQEAEVIFASYFKEYYPDLDPWSNCPEEGCSSRHGVALKYLDRSIQEIGDAYIIYESSQVQLVLHKDGKLYRRYFGDIGE